NCSASGVWERYMVVMIGDHLDLETEVAILFQPRRLPSLPRRPDAKTHRMMSLSPSRKRCHIAADFSRALPELQRPYHGKTEISANPAIPLVSGCDNDLCSLSGAVSSLCELPERPAPISPL